MFITILRYRAKPGEEDAIIALHEDWQRTQQQRARGYHSGELIRNVRDACEFLALMRFTDQEAAYILAHDPEQIAWQQRLASLTERTLTRTEYTGEWCSIGDLS